MNKVDRLLREIEKEVGYTREWTGKSALASEVIEAIREVPRHRFVPELAQAFAYENGPLSIGHGQTISQPFIVALMTDLLNPGPNSVILEVGTGSGYQAAVLAILVRQVYSVEIVPELASKATRLLKNLDYANVEVRQGDGYYGWPEHAPYDGIIVTAAAPMIPPRLVQQLKPDANLVIPVGEPLSHQELMVVSKKADGEVVTRNVLSVAFVPLTGSHSRQPPRVR
ncbi:MAG: protein-L-isoaspartate(D-aspartate) O-methyltransferase [Methylococcaceae bacterium]|nr:protein-L-isoaspartate(D-aspartate) O-methyltransferase [Methylococcaceae bacterium]MCI0732886.1 protein-L-isoaspartate(D-aspartate) O-methyltransferase [Methylococcaceae bacterium]